MATPRVVKPLGPYCVCMPIRMGISPRHGSHHVAQKFTSTTFPFMLASVTRFPCRSSKVTFGSADKAAAFPDPADGVLIVHPEKTVATINVSTAKNSAFATLSLYI